MVQEMVHVKKKYVSITAFDVLVVKIQMYEEDGSAPRREAACHCLNERLLAFI